MPPQHRNMPSITLDKPTPQREKSGEQSRTNFD
jgi:hypothetical protein